MAKKEKTSVVQFKNITLKQGARLIYKGIVDISADNLAQIGDASRNGNYVSIGQAGGNGGCGGNGGKGGNGDGDNSGTSGTAGAAGQEGAVNIPPYEEPSK